ncbi:MAG: TetR family transcriptional regulator [Salinibacterium sp.]|nr:TetR family transcriptional regulator [Salinibacterium sp.]
MFNNGDMGKSEQTRQAISEIALRSFAERGYEATTIRLIASEAGISVGNAYYYFPTKNHMVQELYVRVQTEHRDLAQSRMLGVTDLAQRLEIVLMAGLDSLASYHDSAPGFLAAAISPLSAVNPLSPESSAARDIVVGLFAELVSGSTTVVPAYLRERLPEVLWLAYLGLALFWVYDTSPGQAKSHRLVTRAVRLFGSLLPLARLPLLRGPIAEALDIVIEARS